MSDYQLEKFAERLTKLIKVLNHSRNSFSKSLGYTNSATLVRAASGRNAPSIKMAMDIATAYPEVNLDWLITGRGEALTSGLIDHVETKQVAEPVAPYGNQEKIIELYEENRQLLKEVGELKERLKLRSKAG